jgi:hypothetical protein
MGEIAEKTVEKLFPPSPIDCPQEYPALRAVRDCDRIVAIVPRRPVRGEDMKVVLKLALVAALLSATVANAGGPVLIEEGNNELIEEGNNELVEGKSVRSAGILPVLGLLVLACLVACGKSGGGAGAPAPVDPKVK